MEYLNRINSLCIDRGIKRSELSKAVGIPDSTLRGWNSCIPNVEYVYKVSQFFNITVEEFITGNAPETVLLSEEQKELLINFDALPKEDREELVAFSKLKRALRS